MNDNCKECSKRMRDYRIIQAKKQKRQFIFMMTILILTLGYLMWQVNSTMNELKSEIMYKPVITEIIANPTQIIKEEYKDNVQDDMSLYTYNEMELPLKTNGEFKTYMDYRTITNKSSKQWYLQQLATTNEEGFRVFNGKYLVAVGTYYANEIGKELKITLEDGTVFLAIVGDIKNNIHTDQSNRYIEKNGNIIEFIVDTDKLNSKTKKLGDVSNLGFEGKIIMIEEVINNGKVINSN